MATAEDPDSGVELSQDPLQAQLQKVSSILIHFFLKIEKPYWKG